MNNKNENRFSPLQPRVRVETPEGIQEREDRLHQKSNKLPPLKDGSNPEEDTLP